MKRVLIYLFAIGLVAGCSNDDDPPSPLGPAIPPPLDRTTPQNAVMYYAVAWENRDSTSVDSVLAVDYEGTSTDIGATTETLSFTKSDEIRAVHNMKNDISVTRVTVAFGPPSSWTRTSYVSDPPEWAAVIINNFSIMIHVNSGSDMVVSSTSTTMEFKLKPATVAGTDTTWQIVRWKEVHTQ